MNRYTLPIVLFISSTLFSQTVDEPLYLDITFPTPSDTVHADKVRLSGHTLPGVDLRINDNRVELYPQGSFVTRVDLQEGMNQIIVVAQKGDELVQDILFIYRPEKLKSLESMPTRLDNALLEPSEDIWLMNGDYLTVACKGSPGGQAKFSVERLGKNLPMTETPVEQTNGIAGIYRGAVKLNDLPDNRPLDIDFELIGLDTKRKRISAPGKLYIMSDQLPLIGMTKTHTFIHSASKGYLPFARIPDSVKVHIIGRENERFKIDLMNRTGYLDADDIKLLTIGTPRPQTTIGAPHIEQDINWLHLVFPIGDRLPFQTKVSLDPFVVELEIWGARQVSHWITFPNTTVDIVSLTFEQPNDYIFKMRAQLKQERSWGYKTYYEDGTLRLSIRLKPFIHPQNPVQNLIFAVDPGHGGEETGTTSPLGVFEKDVNRLWAEELAMILQKNGAKVVLTRIADETVSLEARVQKAEEENAHFFVSLHNNATTASGNPQRAQGTSVYFTLPQNKELAWALYPHLVKLGLAPYGRIYNSYFVTNSTGFLVTLVEGGFLTNPLEELKLADQDFVGQMAIAVYDGIVDFLKSQID